MKTAVHGKVEHVNVIRELLKPWSVRLTSSDEAEIVIAYGMKPLENKRTIVIPLDSADLEEYDKNLKPRVNRSGQRLSVPTGSSVVLTISPHLLYCYDELLESDQSDITTMETKVSDNLIILTLDVVREYSRILKDTLLSKSSDLYNLLTGLPLPYQKAPKWLRDLLMRNYKEPEGTALCNKLPLDALRYILINAMENLSGRKIPRRMWNGKRYASMITHDIDTYRGLQRAGPIKKMEEKYDIPSTWYVPSKQYPLDTEIINTLANYGEVGAHGTRHDGELTRIPEQKLVKSLREAKSALENIIDCAVEGFRAPLLQHSPTILRGLREADYNYDSSIPTWEPKHPRTMRSHGLGTVFPIFLDSIIEIPVSVVQDHQMLSVLGMGPKETMAAWLSMIATIREIGGCCVLLSHPEYELFDNSNIAIYEDLLNILTSDQKSWKTTPRELTYRIRE